MEGGTDTQSVSECCSDDQEVPQGTEGVDTCSCSSADSAAVMPGAENGQSPAPVEGGQDTECGAEAPPQESCGSDDAAAPDGQAASGCGQMWGGQYPQVPPGYAVDPATGQLYFVGFPGYQQPPYPGYQQPAYQMPPTPEQIAAQQAAAQQRYGQIIHSVESFLSGETSVADVVKTVYATTAQDDQLWKGILVGAAAAVVLTNGPVREAMGKTFGGIFPGVKGKTAGTEGGGKATSGAAEGDTGKGAQTGTATKSSTSKE